MAHKNGILSQDPKFYSSYEYEEQEESNTQNIFIKVLFQLLLLIGILLVIYFAFNYISNMHIDFKKFNFWNTEKQSELHTHKIKTEVTLTESKMKEQEVDLKRVKVEPIVKKVIKNIHKEKLLEVSKTSSIPLIKHTKTTSQEQRKTSYLSDEYLEAIKKELEKN